MPFSAQFRAVGGHDVQLATYTAYFIDASGFTHSLLHSFTGFLSRSRISTPASRCSC